MSTAVTLNYKSIYERGRAVAENVQRLNSRRVKHWASVPSDNPTAINKHYTSEHDDVSFFWHFTTNTRKPS